MSFDGDVPDLVIDFTRRAPGDFERLATRLAERGAALVDAQPELVAARGALDRLPHPAHAAKLDAFLVEPPPWPPASIQRLAASCRFLRETPCTRKPYSVFSRIV